LSELAPSKITSECEEPTTAPVERSFQGALHSEQPNPSGQGGVVCTHLDTQEWLEALLEPPRAPKEEEEHASKQFEVSLPDPPKAPLWDDAVSELAPSEITSECEEPATVPVESSFQGALHSEQPNPSGQGGGVCTHLDTQELLEALLEPPRAPKEEEEHASKRFEISPPDPPDVPYSDDALSELAPSKITSECEEPTTAPVERSFQGALHSEQPNPMIQREHAIASLNKVACIRQELLEALKEQSQGPLEAEAGVGKLF